MKTDKPVIEYAVLFIVIVAAIAIFWQIKNQDINLARYVFMSLVNGKSAAEKYIDWNNFKAMDMSVGVIYNQLKDEENRMKYRKEFFKNFPYGFNKTGGNLRSFAKWRVYKSEGGKVIVAADYLRYNRAILFTISKLGIGKSKLVSIDWE